MSRQGASKTEPACPLGIIIKVMSRERGASVDHSLSAQPEWTSTTALA